MRSGSKINMEYKTTKSDFDYFCKRAQFWIKYFHVFDWDICFYFNRDEEAQFDQLAYCISNLDGRAATLGFCCNWQETKPTKKQIDLAAFHEVWELILSPLNILAQDRFVTESRIEEARHSIIRRLENTVLREYSRFKK